MNNDLHLSRLLLTSIFGAVKAEGIKDYRKAWVWTSDRRTWEFHYRNHLDCFSASNAYEARAKGWANYLRQEGRK
jgi:hypothetical protein